MKELVFALEFKGSAAAVAGSETRMQASTSASSQTLRTILKADGVHPTLEPSGGEPVAFQSTDQEFTATFDEYTIEPLKK